MAGVRGKHYTGAVLFCVLVAAGWIAGRSVDPVWLVERMQASLPDRAEVVTVQDSVLWPLSESAPASAPSVREELVAVEDAGGEVSYYKLVAVRHFGVWSLLPAAAAVLLCFVLREPVVALSAGIVTGALLLGQLDVTGAVLLPGIGTATGATIVVLYLWFLGGLMGVWSRNGAASAFADWVTARFVRGPRSAKLVTWLLGAAFFQGGTMSTVLVGTTVRPIADREQVSHEELSYLVDSTAAPIAILLPFNAWPAFVASFLVVGGVPFLATEADRVAFFFQNIPLYFYAWFAVGFTFLMAFDRLPFIGRAFREAMRRSRATGQLDAPMAQPLNAKELQGAEVAEGYRPHALEFFIPLLLIIGVTVGTFVFMGSPQVLWGFGLALVTAMVVSLARGMPLREVMAGFQNGLKGVVFGSVVLLLAVVVGGVSREVGAGPFLVELLGDRIPYWMLPVALVAITMVVSFSTGTSWGTFAVSLPLAMPLAWSVGLSTGLENPELFLGICFAAVINGSVFGDQCSPISDTTVLSCMSTGCDLMDHVKTQIVPCFAAMFASVLLWVGLAVLFA